MIENHIEDDIEKFNFYLNGQFEIVDSFLFSSLVKKPSKNELANMKQFMLKSEIEKLYNHFHLEAISNDIKKQRDYAIKLWQQWRFLLDQKFPNYNIIIEVFDYGVEIVIYIYQHPNEERSLTHDNNQIK